MMKKDIGKESVWGREEGSKRSKNDPMTIACYCILSIKLSYIVTNKTTVTTRDTPFEPVLGHLTLVMNYVD